ncbi:MAG TPA: site-2 protease family protein [Thermoanaerobaculia bacterium]|nr:site-2 protease family protein [Thermoanaerobaculia bacterium]
MFGRRITLFRLAGFAVRADASWAIIVILVTWSLATGVFPQLHEGLSRGTYWTMAIAGAIVLFLSIILHELSHSLVARRFGIPMRGITLFVFGGVAEMDDEPPSAKSELLMALAGPAASIVIAVFFFIFAAVGMALGWRTEVIAVAQYVGATNVLLALFNMLPAFPLDGGRVLRALLWMRKGEVRAATRTASQTGSIFGFMLIIGGFYMLFTGNPIAGLWWFLIGMFVRNAAAGAYQQVVVRELLQGEPVRRFMKTDPVTVPRSISVTDLVNDYIYKHHYKMFPVVDEERLVGCVTTNEVKALARDEWDRQTVGSIAQKCDLANTISADTDAMQALARMGKSKVSRLLVVDGERLAGVITLKDLLHFLTAKIELEEQAKA